MIEYQSFLLQNFLAQNFAHAFRMVVLKLVDGDNYHSSLPSPPSHIEGLGRAKNRSGVLAIENQEL